MNSMHLFFLGGFAGRPLTVCCRKRTSLLPRQEVSHRNVDRKRGCFARSCFVLVLSGDPGNHGNQLVAVLRVPGFASQFLLVSADEPLEVGGAVHGALVAGQPPGLEQRGEVCELCVIIAVATTASNRGQVRFNFYGLEILLGSCFFFGGRFVVALSPLIGFLEEFFGCALVQFAGFPGFLDLLGFLLAVGFGL